MLANLNRKQLLSVCEKLIQEIGQDRAKCLIQDTLLEASSSLLTRDLTSSSASSSSPITKKLKRDFDFSKYPQRQVAFWVGYFGEKYNGLQTKLTSKDDTVEWSLISALKRVKLIEENGDFESWNYSRCGRTDKGVSGLGQVISLKVRSTGKQEEMDYLKMLNNNLPDDIFILAWAPIVEQKQPPFSARFSCKNRTYRYFFRPSILNIEKMKQAGALLEGRHDFRNFAKIDLDNQSTFERVIESCTIHHASQEDSNNSSLMYVEIRGTAFLWHQIRLIMAVLFHIGAELEEPTIITELLNIDKNPARPSFTMASELPLLLYSSDYNDELKWQFSYHSILSVRNKLQNRLRDDLIRGELTKTFLNVLNSPPFNSIVDIDEIAEDLDYFELSSLKKRKKHKSILNRPTCKSVDERKEERKLEFEE